MIDILIMLILLNMGYRLCLRNIVVKTVWRMINYARCYRYKGQAFAKRHRLNRHVKIIDIEKEKQTAIITLLFCIVLKMLQPAIYGILIALFCEPSSPFMNI